MFTDISKLIKEKNLRSYSPEGITFVTVENTHEGFGLAKDILYAVVDAKTVLYLSGGSTPKVLYERFANEEKIIPGAVGMVDERFAEKFHETSNEKMFGETGLLRYLQMRNIPFYPILENVPRDETAKKYDETVRMLHATYPKSVGILGIGTDGHTSSLAPNREDFVNPMFAGNQVLVGEFDDKNSAYKERVGMTFLGLSMLDILLVLVFGQDKKKALDLLFEEGPEEQIPARFFKRPDIAKKTLFITDQSI